MGIFDIIQLAIILAVSIGMHEYAHAYVSYKLGDPTPKLQGRLTPNPLRHIDPLGFLMVFTPLHFGWGRPVQINPLYYKNPIKGELLVSLAGPATNIVLSIIAMTIVLIYSKIVGIAPTDIFTSIQLDPMNTFWILFAQLNIVLAVFNLIPVYPLDGYRLIKIFWKKLSDKMEMYPLYSMLIVVAIIFLGSGVISYIVNFIFTILFTLLGQLFY